MRSLPNEWNVIKSKLLEARVHPKLRNELLRRFHSGRVRTNDVQSGQTVAAETSNDHESSGSFLAPSAPSFVAAPPTASTDSGLRDSLIVKLKVYEDFDPTEYTPNTIFMLPGFRYCYCPGSHLQDRIKWASIIEESVAATMRGEPVDGEWYCVYGQGKSIVNEDGELVAEGCLGCVQWRGGGVGDAVFRWMS